MIKINLLPTKGKPRKRKKEGKPFPMAAIVSIAVAIVCIIASIVGLVILSGKVNKLSAKKVEKQAELDVLKKKIEEVEALDAKVTQILLSQLAIEELKENQSVPVKVIDVISNLLPSNVWLTSLSLSNLQLALTGTAFTNSDVVGFVTNLKDVELAVGGQGAAVGSANMMESVANNIKPALAGGNMLVPTQRPKMFKNVFLVQTSSSEVKGGKETGNIPIYNFTVNLQVNIIATADKEAGNKGTVGKAATQKK
ncbi:MAG: PilN domain-containing protein [Candidatus Magnetoovum sp. WYHC-5]|nr:PilN domain-containing protein [Candidatus Magnetoovum sp. WYHC-5]